MYVMTKKEEDFWRELTAPFPNDSYFWRWLDKAQTKQATYLKSRAIQNRLDDVVGPGNWETEDSVSAKGVVCKLSLTVPVGDGETTRTRSGGGPWASGEHLTEETQYKAAFANGFKLAAASFGIGRDLYGEGMPRYCADLHGGFSSGIPVLDGSAGPKATEPTPSLSPTPTPLVPNNWSPPGAASRPLGVGPVPLAPASPVADRTPPKFGWAPPFGKTGGPVFGWIKEMEKQFGVSLATELGEGAKKAGHPFKIYDWDEEVAKEMMLRAVNVIRGLHIYRGEFEQDAAQAPSQPAAPALNISDLRREILAKSGELLFKKKGRAPTTGEHLSDLGLIAAAVPNGQGHTGEVLRGLKECTDVVWLSNLLREVDHQMNSQSFVDASDSGLDDDIPF